MTKARQGLLSLVISLLAGASALAGFPGDAAARVPKVRVVRHSPALAYLLYPEFYRTVEDAAADTTYREASIREVEDYWQANGSRILTLVSELSGLDWEEEEITLYLVEEAPIWGSPDPLIYPIQFWRRGDLVRQAVDGDARGFVLAQLLAHRIFEQVPASKRGDVFQHPLFQPGLGTRETLADLVALWTMAGFAGEEKALSLIRTYEMIAESPALKLVNENFLPAWRLTPKKTLLKFVEEEPRDSELVRKAQGLRESLGGGAIEGRRTRGVERTRIGLRTRVNADGDVVVTGVEPGKLADTGEIFPGDIFIRVGGITVSNSFDVMSRAIAILKAQQSVDIQVEHDGELVDRHMNMAWLKRPANY